MHPTEETREVLSVRSPSTATADAPVAPARHAAHIDDIAGGTAHVATTASDDHDAARRVAVGALIFLAVQLFYIHGDLNLPAQLQESFVLRHLANMAVMGAIAAAMLRPRIAPYWRQLALAGCSFIAVNGAYSSLLVHQPFNELFAVIVIAVGSAALLPWSGWWQGALNAVCVCAFAVTSFAVPDHNQALHWWAVLIGGAAVAQASAVFTERLRNERRSFERRLRENAAKCEGVFRHSLDPISIQRLTDLKFLDVNEAFLKSTRYTREQIIGHDPFELGMVPTERQLTQLVQRLAGSGKAHNVEMDFRTRDGSIAPILISASILELAGEQCLLAIVRDISALKRAEAQILAASEAAQAATHAKSQFLAGMSHEIRTPMNAMLGMADLLWESRLTSEQREYVRIFRSTGGALLKLIDDILDLSKVEAGRLTLELADFNLRDTISSAVEALALRADEKRLALTCEIDPALPSVVSGDAMRLRQVLLNIIGNAIKFTDRGEIVLRVRAGTDIAEAANIEFSITDTGIGIPSDRYREIFEEFTQVDSSTTRKYGGTGLGLAISNQLVKLMGGTISVESEVGRGSTFRFTIATPRAAGSGPLPKPEPLLHPAYGAAHWRALKILLAEDAEDNRALIRAYLTKTRHVLDTASDGLAAVEKYRTGNYDLVLMDVQMPGMDGHAATRAIREFERLNGRPHTPIYALTAFAFRDDAERTRAAGCDGHLTKPIKKATLLALLEKHLQAVADRPLSAAGS